MSKQKGFSFFYMYVSVSLIFSNSDSSNCDETGLFLDFNTHFGFHRLIQKCSKTGIRRSVSLPQF